uniref:substrate-binding domain-containing protein n=1 Tax=uncultured Duncaniella sp. TaxID=2768039 RepID=UPI0026E9692B
MLFTLSGCEESKVYKIGVSQCSQDDWRAKMNDEINREIMFHEDAAVEIRSADDNNAKQIEDIRYFVKNKFDIIIVSPNEAAALTPVIKEVYESGIPVVIFDRNINGDSYTARIGVDDEALGKSAAHYALHLLGSGARAIEIYGLRGSTPAEGRHNGFVREFTGNGGQLVASVPGNWNKEDAMPMVDSLLRKHQDIDLIFAHNDRMAIGASEVASRLGRDNIKIIGIDAAPNIGIQAVADSIIDATFLYPTEGHRLIRTALSILKGEPYQKETIL